jgi:hypothetical protein
VPKRRSSPALCTAATPVFPRPPSRLQSPLGPRFAPPQGRLTPAPVRPQGAPSLPPGRAGRPLRGDRPDPPAKGTFPLPGPGRHRFALTAGPRAFTRTAPRPSDAPLVRANRNFELRADGRHALRGDCRGPPVFSFLLPAPGATSFRSVVPGPGLVCGAPDSRLSPPSSETGGRGRPFFSSGRHLRDAPPRRSP